MFCVKSPTQSFLKSLNKAVSDVGRQVEKGINQAEKEITGAYNSVRSSPLLVSYTLEVEGAGLERLCFQVGCFAQLGSS